MRKLKKMISVLAGLCLTFVAFPQSWEYGAVDHGWKVDWYSSAHMLGGTGSYLPFWERTGNDGILPVTNSGTLTLGTDVGYRSENGWFFNAGAHVAGSLAQKNEYNRNLASALVDRLYVSGGWKMLRLDVGMLPHEKELGELSLTGGNFDWTGNARNIPGINFKMDWLYFEKGHWFGLKANFAHYQYIDNRATKGAMLHNKSLFGKVACGRKVDLIVGLEHIAQWGGTLYDGRVMPSSFKDYLRVILGMHGGEDATASDQSNVLGNHLGHELVRVVWRARPFVMTLQYDKPFEDGSGVRQQNFPDGLWTLQFNLTDRKAAVTDITFEFLTSTWQSGPAHDRPATPEDYENQEKDHLSIKNGRVILGGVDNYFNNSEYASGWTNHGRVVGMPLFTACMPDENGIVKGVCNNRVRAYHFGMAGNVVEGLPYQLKSTFSKNYGRYRAPWEDTPWQLSLALEFRFEKAFSKLPVTFAAGIYGDIGKLFQNSFGLSLRIIYKGSKYF